MKLRILKTKLMPVAILLSALAVVTVPASADELLSILGGKGDDSPVLPEQSVQNEYFDKILPKRSAEQNIFVQFFNKGDLKKALFQWPAAFKGTSFERSSEGQALHAYLMFVNGLKIIGVEKLLQNAKPNELSKTIVQMWKEAAPVNLPQWEFVTATWNPEWTNHFGVAAEVKVRARQLFDPEKYAVLEEMVRKTGPDSWERAWLQWQLTLSLGLQGEAAKAARVLANLMTAKNNPISKDLMTMTAARFLYENGFLDAAIEYYSKIGKASDYWFDAQEEMAWAYVRKGEPQNTIAITKTLVHEGFAPQVGPETVFLRSLAQLKVCDYPAVSESLALFRQRFQPKAKVLLKIKETAEVDGVKKYIEQTRKSRKTLMELGGSAAELPRLVTRDEVLYHNIRVYNELEKEAKTANELFGQSLSEGTSQVGFQAAFDELRQGVEQRSYQAYGAALSRIQVLAEGELDEIKRILDKLHIVEAELIQQISQVERVISSTQSMKPDRKVGSTGSKSKDAIWFPYEGETWFDELSNYKVDIKKGCQAKAQ